MLPGQRYWAGASIVMGLVALWPCGLVVDAPLFRVPPSWVVMCWFGLVFKVGPLATPPDLKALRGVDRVGGSMSQLQHEIGFCI